jgi:hypothetical protein
MKMTFVGLVPRAATAAADEANSVAMTNRCHGWNAERWSDVASGFSRPLSLAAGAAG